MASSDAYANAALLREVSRGGSVYLGLLDTIPPDDLSTFSLISGIPAVALALNGATTWTVAARAAHPINAISLDPSALVTDVVPVAWCLFEDAGRTQPSLSGRLADIKVTPDSTVNVPAETVQIRYPATLADTL